MSLQVARQILACNDVLIKLEWNLFFSALATESRWYSPGTQVSSYREGWKDDYMIAKVTVSFKNICQLGFKTCLSSLAPQTNPGLRNMPWGVFIERTVERDHCWG